jgi:HEAT repeat protein
VDESAEVRAAALGALARLGAIDGTVRQAALTDPSPVVRKRACELALALAGVAVGAAPGGDSPRSPEAGPDFLPLLGDGDDGVVEAACFAVGELRDDRPGVLAELVRIAADHEDALCRESAVAALGAIGHPSGLAAILGGLTDKPAVRRRAVIALAPFEGEEVEAALRRALEDRDWQVRQAAEDLLAEGR